MSGSLSVGAISPLLALALLGTARPLPATQHPPAEDGAGEETLVMHWSETDRVSPSVARWHRANAPGLAAVEDAWSRLLRRLGGQLPARFAVPCRLLAERLGELDGAALFPAPDRLLDLYLQRMIWHLRRVAERCRPDELWNVVYHLEEARRALGEVRWVLERNGLPDGWSDRRTLAEP